MSWLRVLILTSWVVFGIVPRSTWAQAPAAEATKADEARVHFTRGSELYTTGDLRGTLAEFERAYELRPSPLLSFHIGQVARELRRFARSYLAFKQFLATETPADTLDAGKRTEAEAMLKDLEPRIARLTLESNVHGARFSIDEQPFGEAPLAEPIVLDVGTYRVRASQVGFAALTRVISLAGGDESALRLDLEPLELPAAAIVPRAEPTTLIREKAEPRRTLMTPGLWAGFGTAAVLAVAGGGIGIYALRASSELDRKRFEGPSAQEDFADDSDRVRVLAMTSDILLGAALVGAQTSIVLLLLRSRRHSRATTRVAASLQPRALMIEGAF